MKTIHRQRVFLGLNLPRELKSKLALYEWELTKQNLPFRFEDEKKLHLTLLFLGNEDPRAIKKILPEIASKHATFILKIEQLEAFPGFNHPKTLYLSLSGDLDELKSLQKDIRTRLKGTGIFTPHITLAKFAKPPYPIHIKQMGNKLVGLKIKPPQESFLVKEVSLFESKLTQEGSTYKILKTWPLRHKSY